MIRFGAAVIALALVPQISTATEITRARYLMGTVCEVAADRPEQVSAAFDEATRIERFLSTWRDDSELSRLNRGEATSASPELQAQIKQLLGV